MKTMKLTFTLLTALLLAPLALTPSAVAAEGGGSPGESRKPNVVVLFIDDLGYGDIGAFGCPDIPTPHIDSLARDGVRCLNGYTLMPVCSPSRSGLMTGLYPQRYGVNGNNQRGTPIPTDHPTIAEFMRDAGYVTGMVGRWDLGDTTQGPLERGFLELARRQSPKKRPEGDPLTGEASYWGTDGTYLTEVQGDRLVEFVERNQAKPFFLYFAPLAVHSAVQDAPEKYLKRVPASVQGMRRYHAGTLIALDDAIGKLLGALRKCGLDNDTLIFFTGDNGGVMSNEARNAPYRGGKVTKWNGGVHEPFIVRWTGRLPAGKDFNGLVSTLDIYPTAAAVAGAKPPERLDGVNILPYLLGQKSGDPHEALFWRYLDIWKSTHPDPTRAVRSGPWRLFVGEKELELYNLVDDPGETRNLAGENPERVAALKALFDKWEAALPAPKETKRLRSSEPPAGVGWAYAGDRKEENTGKVK